MLFAGRVLMSMLKGTQQRDFVHRVKLQSALSGQAAVQTE